MSEQIFTLNVNAQDLAAIAAGLQELKAKVSMPIIQKLNAQLAPQIATFTAAALAPSHAGPKPEGRSDVNLD